MNTVSPESEKIACVVGVRNHRGKSGAREYEMPATLYAFHFHNLTNFWPPLQKPITHATYIELFKSAWQRMEARSGQNQYKKMAS